jgi:hypothetical protein
VTGVGLYWLLIGVGVLFYGLAVVVVVRSS